MVTPCASQWCRALGMRVSCCVQIVIASFEDAYHVRTLQQLLQTCLLLQPGVEVHRIMSLLMDRLTEYAAQSDDAIFQDDAAFQCFLSAACGCGIKCVPV